MRFNILLLVFSLSAYAQDLNSKVNEQALQQAVEMLKNPSLRAQEQKGSASAKQSDETARNLAGTPENTQKMYDISAKALDKVARESNGNPEKMMDLLNKAQENPEGFFNLLGPEQQREIQNLARDIEKHKSVP